MGSKSPSKHCTCCPEPTSSPSNSPTENPTTSPTSQPTKEPFTCFDHHTEHYPICLGQEEHHYCDGRSDCQVHPEWCDCGAGQSFCNTGVNPCMPGVQI